jgi:preprotein translocase subunit SecD
MRANTWRFNLFLVLMALAVLCGCQTGTKNKEVGVLRVHIESKSGNTGASQTVSLLRSDPVLITIETAPILTEANMVEARVIDTRGGFALQVQFDEISAGVLEQYSAANPGRHFAIFGQWGERPAAGRWLAAPLITHRFADGILSFTPDMSREEADRLALGLNNAAKKIHKGLLK